MIAIEEITDLFAASMLTFPRIGSVAFFPVCCTNEN